MRRLSVTTQPVFVFSCWLVIAVTGGVDPLRLASAWPVAVFAFLVIVRGSVAALRAAVACKEPLFHTRLHIQLMRAVLVLLAGCSIAGAITSIVPSMAYFSESGDMLYAYGVGGLIAPMLWGAIFSASVGAIVDPAPRRIALAAGSGLVGWLLLLILRVVSEPLIDLDMRVRVLVPWIVKLYVVAAFVASGLAMVLAIGAARLATGSVMRMPPKASVVRVGPDQG
jgi:hypothetical protein